MRRKITVGAISAVAPVGVLAFILLSARTPVEMRCIAVLEPDTVAIQTTPIDVAYTVPDTIGTITRVQPPEDSGIRLVALDALKRSMTLDVSSATASDWTLNLVAGGTQICAATLTILQAESRGPR